MIDEAKQELTIQYLLGELGLEAEESFRRELDGNPELASFAKEMSETLGLLAYANPPLRLPKALPDVIAQARFKRSAWIPWAIAACLAAACLVLFSDHGHLWQQLYSAQRDLASARSQLGNAQGQLAGAQTELSGAKGQLTEAQAQLTETKRQLSGVQGDLAKTQTQLTGAKSELAGVRDELATARNTNQFAQVQIALLKAQFSDFAKANAIVVWDGQTQAGVVQVDRFPAPQSGKDYQLWILAPNKPAPISAGLVRGAFNQPVRDQFKPQQQVGERPKFAISVEPTGGSSAPSGRIIFVGQ